MKSSHLLFARKLILFILALILIDIGLGKILEHFFFKIDVGETSRITYSVNEAKEDIIILGSSRANHHYDTKIIEDSLKQTSYNTGMDGQSILYYYSVLKCVVARNQKQQTIVLDINPNEFIRSDLSYSRLSNLLPYYNRHPEIRETVDLKSPFEKLKALSNLYRYNSYLFTIIVNNVLDRQEISSHGYIPLEGDWHRNLDEKIVYVEKNDIDTNKVHFFRSFLKTAQQANRNVVILVSPFFQKFADTPESIKIAENICKEYGVSFNNYSQSAVFLQHGDYFFDVEHLNKKGAGVYTNMILRLLQTITI